MRRSGTCGSFTCVAARLSLPAGKCIALIQHGKDKQDIVYTWSCCGAAGCKAAGAASVLRADDCANPAGACITDCSFDQPWHPFLKYIFYLKQARDTKAVLRLREQLAQPSIVYNLTCGKHMQY